MHQRTSEVIVPPPRGWLLAAILLGTPAVAQDSPGRGLFVDRGCEKCHSVAGMRTFESTEQRQKEMLGPDLWFAGSKFQEAWLRSWLRNPTAIRGVRWNTIDTVSDDRKPHPSLTAKEADPVADYLMSLEDKYMRKTGIKVVAKLPRRTKRQAKKLFFDRWSCYACHRSVKRKKITGGVSGPRLANAGLRLNPDWVYQFLRTPSAYESKGRMPHYKGFLGEDDMKVVAEYLATFQLEETGFPVREKKAGQDDAESVVKGDSPVERRFRWYCTQCHGLPANGTGPNALPELPTQPMHLVDHNLIGKFTDEQITNTVTRGGLATNLATIMPPWGNTFTSKEIQELVRFVRKLGGEYDPSLGPRLTEKKAGNKKDG